MVKTEEKRIRPGDLFLLAILLSNLVCGVGLIGALRADLSKDLVAAESTLASSKISAYLWGKILRFTSTVEQRRRVGENAPLNGDVNALSVVGDLSADWNFQRIRSGTRFRIPVMRNLNVHSVEAKHYAERTCSSSFSENPKCWLRHVPPEFFTEEGNPQIHRDAISACLRGEVFPPSALLVVRSVEYGKALNRESAVPISNLAPEAGIALDLVSINDDMKIMSVTYLLY